MTANSATPVIVPTVARAVPIVVLLGGLGVSAIVTLVGLTTYQRPGSYESTPFGDLGAFVFEVTLLSLGFLLRSRRPSNAIGWLFLAFGICAMFSHVAWATMQVSYLPGGDRTIGGAVSWLGSVGSILTWTYLLASVVIRFPDGQPDTPGEARLLRWLPLFCIAAAAGAAIRPGPLLVYPAFDNPIATPPYLDGVLTAASNLALLSVLVPTVVAGRAIVRRYREATNTERLQLRWFAFGATISLSATAIYVVFGVLVAPDNSVVREGTYAIFVASLASLPIAVFQAITSHRLYDIDRIIGRTFAYGALTAILAGLYAASVRGFNWVFVSLTGEESEAALVLTTLVLATTFTPIKSRLEKIAGARLRPQPTEAVAELALEPELEAAIRRVVIDVLGEREVATGGERPRVR